MFSIDPSDYVCMCCEDIVKPDSFKWMWDPLYREYFQDETRLCPEHYNQVTEYLNQSEE